MITRCRLIMQIQTLLFRQRRHHSLCMLQLNNVQAFVNVLGSRFHCESSAVTIVYTSVLESQVCYWYSWIESFSSLDHDQFRDLRQEFFKCRWLGTDERVVYMRYHTCFVRFMHKQTSLQFATFETLCSISIPARNSVKSRLAVRMPFIAPCSLQIHPSRSCPFGGRANISQDESACMKAHTRSPVSTRRSNHAAYNNSPRTDSGDGVGARWSWRKYIISHCRREILQHTSRSHFTPLQSSSPTCEQNRFVGRYVSLLDPRVQLQIFHLLDFSFISGLDFVSGQSIHQGAFIYFSNNQVCVRPSFLVDIKFHTVLSTN